MITSPSRHVKGEGQCDNTHSGGHQVLDKERYGKLEVMGLHLVIAGITAAREMSSPTNISSCFMLHSLLMGLGWELLPFGKVRKGGLVTFNLQLHHHQRRHFPL